MSHSRCGVAPLAVVNRTVATMHQAEQSCSKRIQSSKDRPARDAESRAGLGGESLSLVMAHGDVIREPHASNADFLERRRRLCPARHIDVLKTQSVESLVSGKPLNGDRI